VVLKLGHFAESPRSENAALAWRECESVEDGRPGAGGERLRLFRDGRLATAAVGLAAFPALAVIEIWPVAAALLLCGFLPAAIALDCRRPADLDRAAAMGLVCAAAFLAGATIEGLPVALACAFVAIQAMEALVVSGRIARIAAIAGSALACVAACGLAASAAADPAMPAATAALLLMLTANAGLLVRGLVVDQSEMRRRSADDRLQADEIEAVMAETIIAADRSGAVVRVSANAQRVLGLPAEAIAGRGLSELTLVADRPELLTALRDCAHGGPARRLRLRMRASLDAAQPHYRHVECAIAPGADVALASLRDISESVAQEEARTRLTAQSEAASRARAAFLSTVNHELRTPLNAIIGFSDIIANPATTPASVQRLREYAQLINGAGHDLLRIVTAMIDITRLDSGVYEFEAEPTELGVAVSGAVEAFKLEPMGACATIELLQAQDRVEAAIDERAFRAVLHQILSNAVKFGAGGAVAVTTGCEDGWATVTVSDRGRGLAADKLAQIGRHFARVDEGLERERGGVGLGLSLAAGLMALHGGRIEMRSNPGSGTVVTLRLPKAGVQATVQTDNVRPLAPRAAGPAVADDVPNRMKRRA